jgi:hypothetical protein
MQIGYNTEKCEDGSGDGDGDSNDNNNDSDNTDDDDDNDDGLLYSLCYYQLQTTWGRNM